MKLRETYIGKSLFGRVTVRAEVGDGNQQRITITVADEGSSFSLFTSEVGAQELAKMLAAAAETIRSEFYSPQSRKTLTASSGTFRC